MDVAITGSHGLVGSALVRSLKRDGHQPIRVVRSASGKSSRNTEPTVNWDPTGGEIDSSGLEGVDAVVNLAGEGIAAGRWTSEQKRKIRDSRTMGTDLLSRTLADLDSKPRILISGSAVGYYGSRGDEELDEQSAPGDDFLASVCVDWEAATAPAEAAGIPVAHIRTGVVLSSEGGMLDKLLLPFKLGLGGKDGDGQQWLSWIALADMVGAIRFMIDQNLTGPVNLTAPNPARNVEFVKTLGKVLNRPTVLPVPRFIAKLPLGIGDLVDSLLFTSANVQPKALLAAGYNFSYSSLEDGLRSILSKSEEVAGS